MLSFQKPDFFWLIKNPNWKKNWNIFISFSKKNKYEKNIMAVKIIEE